MTAREKAVEILKLFDKPVEVHVTPKLTLPISLHDEQKKAFATIVVDAKMEELDGTYSIEFYKKVKREIEKL